MKKNQNLNNLENIKPFKKNNNIPIVLATDKNYVKYASVTIQSIIETSSKKNNYDIIICDGGIEEKNRKKIKLQLKNHIKNNGNFTIRFIDINKYINLIGKEIFYESEYISIAAYYRLFIPTFMQNYNKCLYLDVDIVLLEDVANLYKQNLDDKVLAACHDLGMFIDRNNNKKQEEFLQNELKLKSTDKYFNSGVLLIDVNKFKDYQYKCFKLLEQLKTPKNHDQDILNAVLNHKIKYLDHKWNFMNSIVNSEYKRYENDLPEKDKNYFMKLKQTKSFKLLHYSSKFKPWIFPKIDDANYFWQYAKNTPFYNSLKFNLFIYKYLIIKDLLKKLLKYILKQFIQIKITERKGIIKILKIPVYYKKKNNKNFRRKFYYKKENRNFRRKYS